MDVALRHHCPPILEVLGSFLTFHSAPQKHIKGLTYLGTQFYLLSIFGNN